ncbi:spore coat U domain-containing protein [Sodalis sp. C49]|uniref:Csu type fimbrial protein n=1 Tax=unclassified Sodalis (in: enterobacteria) TaxID=2636512 RepID=UPI003965A1FD
MSSQRLFKVGALSLLCLGATVASSAFAAGTATTNIAVTAEVQSACTIATTAMAFPAYTGTDAVDTTATLSLTCSNAAPYTVALGAGTGTDATTAVRVMTGSVAGSTLNYGLYQNIEHTTNWGEATGDDTVAGVGTGGEQNITVYGEIAANQLTSAVGDYTDTVAVTVTY